MTDFMIRRQLEYCSKTVRKNCLLQWAQSYATRGIYGAGTTPFKTLTRSRWRFFVERRSVCGATQGGYVDDFPYGAGEGNRTLVVSLGSRLENPVSMRVCDQFTLHKISR